AVAGNAAGALGASLSAPQRQICPECSPNHGHPCGTGGTVSVQRSGGGSCGTTVPKASGRVLAAASKHRAPLQRERVGWLPALVWTEGLHRRRMGYVRLRGRS